MLILLLVASRESRWTCRASLPFFLLGCQPLTTTQQLGWGMLRRTTKISVDGHHELILWPTDNSRNDCKWLRVSGSGSQLEWPQSYLCFSQLSHFSPPENSVDSSNIPKRRQTDKVTLSWKKPHSSANKPCIWNGNCLSFHEHTHDQTELQSLFKHKKSGSADHTTKNLILFKIP